MLVVVVCGELNSLQYQVEPSPCAGRTREHGYTKACNTSYGDHLCDNLPEICHQVHVFPVYVAGVPRRFRGRILPWFLSYWLSKNLTDNFLDTSYFRSSQMIHGLRDDLGKHHAIDFFMW